MLCDMLRIIVCAKEVVDPDGVNARAVSDRLEIAEDGRKIVDAGLVRLMNAYDEQAIEAALRLRDAGIACSITVVTVGDVSPTFFRRAAAMGADERVGIPLEEGATDAVGIGRVLAAYVRSAGGADLVLCGRQASDDDLGVVPGVVGELLGAPVVTLAQALEPCGERTIRVTRAAANGTELVEVELPAVVTVTSELGAPREPKVKDMLAARRKTPRDVSLGALGLDGISLKPRVIVRRRFVPKVQRNCEIITGETPAEIAEHLLEALRSERLIP